MNPSFFRAIRASLALALLALSTSSCVMQAGSLDLTRINLEEQLPGARFDSEVQMTLGRMSLGLTRAIVNAVDDEEADEGLELLRKIRKVELAVYRTEALPSVRQATFVIPHERRLKKKGWQTVVEIAEDNSASWVMMRQTKGKIRGMMVGALDNDELVLVKLTGDIQEIYEKLITDHILDVPGVVHADLEPEPGEPIVTEEL